MEGSVGATTSSPDIAVDRWSDVLGGQVERRPGLFVRIGDWESRFLGDRIAQITVDRPIYVAGLARSGSTILLELLSKHPETTSHRYRDFPMVLTPVSWNWFVDRAGGQDDIARERAHRDRIAVTRESPEAFEEVIWMTFFPRLHEPATSAVFDDRTSNPRFEAFYRDHIRKLLFMRGGSRYLAKGNYNLTRLRYLRKLFPDARFIVPIRDPEWHVASLMKQHRLFSAAGAKDEKVRRHLRRSGHFEFGLDRKPVNLGNEAAVAEIAALWRDGKEAAGYAAHWAAIYGHVAEALDDPEIAGSIHVVRYEDLCDNPAATVAAVLDHCQLKDAGIAATAAATVAAPNYDAPDFTAAERAEIRRRTEAVAERFGYGQGR